MPMTPEADRIEQVLSVLRFDAEVPQRGVERPVLASRLGRPSQPTGEAANLARRMRRFDPSLERAEDDLTYIPDDRGLRTSAGGEVGFEIGDRRDGGRSCRRVCDAGRQ